jgi:hypothetical protein
MDELQAAVLSRLLSELVLELNAEEAAATAAAEARRSAITLTETHELLSAYEATERSIRQRWLTADGPDAQQLHQQEPQQGREAAAQEQRLQLQRSAVPSCAQHSRLPSSLSLQPRAPCSPSASSSALPPQLPPPPLRQQSEQQAVRVAGWADAWLHAAVGEVAAEVWQCLDGVVDGLVEAELGDDAAAPPQAAN